MSDVRRDTATSGKLFTGSAPAPVLLLSFASTLFLSALLLFAVQPMFAKMVLPVLGGSPAVWSVAMCFFQAALLAGYAYAHCLSARIRTPLAVIIHLCVMLAAVYLLPLGIAQGWGRPPETGLHLWVLGLFAASIGVPFFALAGNAPLLQAWFAKTGHRHADDPYFLYGASNLGSLLALLSYPVVIEPAATLAQQGTAWSLGFKVLALMVGLCGLAMLVSRRPKEAKSQSTALASGPVTGQQRLAWTGLAFVPSGLLVAVTSHISTDVAAAPFLWVLPLALFLLTFVVTFQRKPVIPHKAMLAIQPVAVAALVICMMLPLQKYWLALTVLHLAVFFVCAMVCHGELVRRRPEASNLTSFYLWMSFGGALGGFFTGLLAPNIFSTILEYPLMIVLALFARPGFFSGDRKSLLRDLAIIAILFTVITGPKLMAGIELVFSAPAAYIAILAVLGTAIILSRPHPRRLAGLVAIALAAGQVLAPDIAKGTSQRGFFGVIKVVDTPDGKFRLMMHGTTLHGAEMTDRPDGTKPEPLTYFHRNGPFADVIRAARARGPLANVAVIGLGTGSLACYRNEGENWRFFEIDPIVARLADDPGSFSFLDSCAPHAPVVIGDARITLTDQPEGLYNLLVIDAFSSDAIPIHLITREAIALYLSRMADDGILAFHVSNANMDLRPVLAATARELGLAVMTRYGGKEGAQNETYKNAAIVVALARRPSSLEPLAAMKEWEPLPDSGWRVWTDDYSNILQAIFEARGGLKPASALGSQ